MNNLKVKTLILILVSIIGLNLNYGCSKKCSNRVCKFRINIKDGYNYNNEEGMGRFGEKGSPEVCQTQQQWPTVNIVYKKAGTQGYSTIIDDIRYSLGKEEHTLWENRICLLLFTKRICDF